MRAADTFHRQGNKSDIYMSISSPPWPRTKAMFERLSNETQLTAKFVVVKVKHFELCKIPEFFGDSTCTGFQDKHMYVRRVFATELWHNICMKQADEDCSRQFCMRLTWWEVGLDLCYYISHATMLNSRARRSK